MVGDSIAVVVSLGVETAVFSGWFSPEVPFGGQVGRRWCRRPPLDPHWIIVVLGVLWERLSFAVVFLFVSGVFEDFWCVGWRIIVIIVIIVSIAIWFVEMGLVCRILIVVVNGVYCSYREFIYQRSTRIACTPVLLLPWDLVFVEYDITRSEDGLSTPYPPLILGFVANQDTFLGSFVQFRFLFVFEAVGAASVDA